MAFSIQDIISGQPSLNAERKQQKKTDDFKRGVQTANLYVQEQKMREREQNLTLREALFERQNAEFIGLQQATEEKAAQVGGIIGQIMGEGSGAMPMQSPQPVPEMMPPQESAGGFA